MSTLPILIIVILLLMLPTGVYLFLRKRNAPVKREKAEWAIDAQVRRLIESTPEIRALYAKVGYFPETDRKVEGLVNAMTGLIRTEIPDFAAFQSALRAVQDQKHDADSPGPLSPAPDQRANEALLKAVLQVRNDERKVLEYLNRDPVYEQLPFVEQIPAYRDGQVVWRTPVEHSVIRKRPTDAARFAQLLDETEQLVETAEIRRSQQAGLDVLEVVARLRNGLKRENAYFPTLLKALEDKLTAWSHAPQNAAPQGKREHLDNFLKGIVSVRYAYGSDSSPRPTLKKPEFDRLKGLAEQHAKTYLDTPWLQTPWLTNYLLTNLINSELAPLARRVRRKPNSPAGVLKRIRDEVTSGRYDSDENIRRLRQQEETGLYVHTLVYPLLRLNRVPSAMTASERRAFDTNRPFGNSDR